MENKTLKISADLHESLKKLSDIGGVSMQYMIENKLSEILVEKGENVFSFKSVNVLNNDYQVVFNENQYISFVNLLKMLVLNSKITSLDQINNLIAQINKLSSVIKTNIIKEEHEMVNKVYYAFSGLFENKKLDEVIVDSVEDNIVYFSSIKYPEIVDKLPMETFAVVYSPRSKISNVRNQSIKSAIDKSNIDIDININKDIVIPIESDINFDTYKTFIKSNILTELSLFPYILTNDSIITDCIYLYRINEIYENTSNYIRMKLKRIDNDTIVERDNITNKLYHIANLDLFDYDYDENILNGNFNQLLDDITTNNLIDFNTIKEKTEAYLDNMKNWDNPNINQVVDFYNLTRNFTNYIDIRIKFILIDKLITEETISN